MRLWCSSFWCKNNQNNQKTMIQKYTKDNMSNIAAPDFSKEQTKSILNISSQGGTNMSFINYKILTQDKRPKSKEIKNLSSSKAPMEYSPKYALKKQSEWKRVKQIDRKMIKAKKSSKNQKSINPNYQKGNQAIPKINVVYSLIDKKWKYDDAIDRCRTHDERPKNKF